MQFFIIMLGSVLAASGTIPYIIQTIGGKTKPRIVTWLTWALLTGAAGWAALADHQLGSAVFALMGTVATGTVVLVGWRYGDRSFALLDIVCISAVIVGLVLWYLFGTAELAVWVAIIVDFIGLLPTLKHAWQKPHEETSATFVLVGLGGLLTTVTIITDGSLSVTALGYPLYVALSMGSCAAIIILRKIKIPTPGGAEAPSIF